MKTIFNGAEGDVGPRLSNGKTIGDITHTREFGSRAAFDAVCAYRNIKEYSKVNFKITVDTISIPYRQFDSLEKTKKN